MDSALLVSRLILCHVSFEILKKFPAPKFDPTVTLSFKLAVDPRKSDQMVRGTCALPHGTGKKIKVIVFAQGEAAKAAEAAGADKVGYEDLIKEVQELEEVFLQKSIQFPQKILRLTLQAFSHVS